MVVGCAAAGLVDARLVGGVVVELLRGHALVRPAQPVEHPHQLLHTRTLPRPPPPQYPRLPPARGRVSTRTIRARAEHQHHPAHAATNPPRKARRAGAGTGSSGQHRRHAAARVGRGRHAAPGRRRCRPAHQPPSRPAPPPHTHPPASQPRRAPPRASAIAASAIFASTHARHRPRSQPARRAGAALAPQRTDRLRPADGRVPRPPPHGLLPGPPYSPAADPAAPPLPARAHRIGRGGRGVLRGYR